MISSVDLAFKISKKVKDKEELLTKFTEAMTIKNKLTLINHEISEKSKEFNTFRDKKFSEQKELQDKCEHLSSTTFPSEYDKYIECDVCLKDLT